MKFDPQEVTTVDYPGTDGKTRKVVATLNVPVYETWEELTAKEPQDKILKLFNVQNRTTMMNDERRKHTSKPESKSALRDKALAELAQTPELFAQAVANIPTDQTDQRAKAVQDLIQSKIDEIQKRQEAERAASGQPAPDTTPEGGGESDEVAEGVAQPA